MSAISSRCVSVGNRPVTALARVRLAVYGASGAIATRVGRWPRCVPPVAAADGGEVHGRRVAFMACERCGVPPRYLRLQNGQVQRRAREPRYLYVNLPGVLFALTDLDWMAPFVTTSPLLRGWSACPLSLYLPEPDPVSSPCLALPVVPPPACAAVKAKGDNLRVHFKHCREVAAAIRGLSLDKAKTLLADVLEHKQAIAFRRFNSGCSQHAQGKPMHAPGNSVRWPEKATRHFIDLLENAEANAEVSATGPADKNIGRCQPHSQPPRVQLTSASWRTLKRRLQAVGLLFTLSCVVLCCGGAYASAARCTWSGREAGP